MNIDEHRRTLERLRREAREHAELMYRRPGYGAVADVFMAYDTDLAGAIGGLEAAESASD
jgi:hypothetical protein